MKIFGNLISASLENIAGSVSGSLSLIPNGRIWFNTVTNTIQYKNPSNTGLNLIDDISTQTITGKTMSGASNTFTNIGYSSLSITGSIVNADISNSAAIAYSKLSLSASIVNADISASAAIARSKIASGSASQVVVNDGSGNLSSVAALGIANGGTGAATASAGFDAISPTTTKGDIIVRNSSTNTRLPIGTDGQVPVADSAQANGLAWKTLQQGAKNYITYNSFENNATTGWSLAHTAVSTANGYTLPTGAASAGVAFDSSHGGSAVAGTLSFITISSGQLAGTYSGQLVSSAATTQGDALVSQAYTIDAEDQAKMLAFKFAYKLASGTGNFSGTASNSFSVWIYDVTNAAWIQPAGTYNLVQSSGVGIAQGTFQTPSNMTQFQIVIVCANATSGAISLTVDDFSVGPQTVAYGPAMDDFVAFTPTITGFGAVSGVSFASKREGDSLRVIGSFVAGTPTAVNAQIGLGYRGVSGNAVTASTIAANNICGTGHGTSTNAATFTYLLSPGNAYVQMGLQFSSSSTVFSPQTGSALAAAGEAISVDILVPIAGWSSNSAMSADTDTRVIAYSAIGATATVTGSNSDITWTTVKDAAASYSGTTYTIPVSGWYFISAQVRIDATYAAGNDSDLSILIDGNIKSTGIERAGGAQVSQFPKVSNVFYLNAGQAVKIQISSGGTSPTLNNGAPAQNFLTIFKLSGPAVIAASERVACRYTTTAAQSIANTTDTQIVWGTKDYDTHGAMNASTGLWTAPCSGPFRISAVATMNTIAATYIIYACIYKNGSMVSMLDYRNLTWQADAGTVSGSDTLNLNAGDTIGVYIDQRSGSAKTMVNAAGYNHVQIELVK